ncbi:hypothetical protein QMZ92_23590 [Streptomyces sp. HNM0645]|uniref:hypothetical protein n=1 Tax=Streptomyces sp. HNM0645 TaxID=2782343 RepID=UPI0024B8395C|nr:hypothetical protein [Streptomyces sp. HNM0645]MDI9887270.1 hypothetical protein [Streptomyces sp. HNM0645]
MSPTLRELGSVRSAAVVNAEIRALWAKSGSRLSAADEAKYQHLLVEWAEAVDAERSEDAAADEDADGAGTAPPAPRTGAPLRLIRAA